MIPSEVWVGILAGGGIGTLIVSALVATNWAFGRRRPAWAIPLTAILLIIGTTMIGAATGWGAAL